MAETTSAPRARRKRSDARVRRHPDLPPKRERVALLRRMLAEGTYRTGITCADLAAKWGCVVNTVERDAADAARELEVPEEEKQLLRAAHIGRLSRLADDAQKGPRMTRQYGAAVNALALIGKYQRLEPDERSAQPSVTVVVGQIAHSPVTRALVGAESSPEVVKALFGEGEVEVDDAAGPAPKAAP